MELKFKKSNKESFDIYKSWFTDKELNRQLGPMDEETWEKWQDYHKIEKSEELAVYLNNELGAVIDISLPTKDYPLYCILACHSPSKKEDGNRNRYIKIPCR